ncbi:MAG: hypothetical protein WA883_20890 [Phormidesmis sp.]
MYTRLRKVFGLPILLSVSLFNGVWLTAFSSTSAIAQQVNPLLRQEFLANPLASEPRDPLLPVLGVDREYSPLEKRAIAANLNQLNQEAQVQLAAGNPDEAFAIWRREIKLRRVLGTQAELAVIQQVSPVAWGQQRTTDVQLLTLRTREIWDVIRTSLGVEVEDELGDSNPSSPTNSPISGAPTADIALLSEIAQTFVTLRDIDSAVDVYQQIIRLSAGRDQDQTAQQIALAELHLEWFQFAEAANLYLQLLNQARAQNDAASEQAYLERLVYGYQQADALLNAVRAQTDLLAIYQAQGEAEKLPELLLAIAQNYRALNLPTNAIEYYRVAYSTAQRSGQFSFSARVLQELGALYQAIALTDDALGAYTLLVLVEGQAYNDYGIMNAYDSIGQLQRRQGNALEALKAFEKALVIANRLGLREDYFVDQIESVT